MAHPHQYSLGRLLGCIGILAVVLGLWRVVGSYVLLLALAVLVVAIPWRQPRWLYSWLLPCIWTAVAWVNFSHPGDEYGGFAAGSLAGIWIVTVVGPISNVRDALPPVLVTGALTVATAGWLLDKLRTPWRLWAPLWFITAGTLFFWSIGSYASIERALSKNGSYAASAMPSLNLGLYAATLLSLTGGGIYRLMRLWAAKSPATRQSSISTSETGGSP